MSPLAMLLREVRVGLGLSQVGLATALGLKGPYISGVETGKRYAPLLANLEPGLSGLGLTSKQVKRLYSAERMSPRLVKLSPAAPQEAFIFAATLQENLGWLERDDFIKLTAYVQSLTSKQDVAPGLQGPAA
ncbi:transcriptional regulator [Chromobacterium piscinae]|uniref:helix-turn-helix domain-containing protein n=1 Tax=Chromobacterium piscinae TaxID=686831 RepID=UPI001E407BB9|nr:transcriptional regulator [Chromobacterium piscinae]MCD4504174.1 transcriptional regulator [Chromobacterium piscinae]